MADLDLVAYLKARLSEEAETARKAAFGWGAEWVAVKKGNFAVLTSAGSSGMAGSEDIDVIEHAALWDPARVLAEVEAKRAIIDLCEPWGLAEDIAVLRLLAQVYADRPDFNPAWLPAVP